MYYTNIMVKNYLYNPLHGNAIDTHILDQSQLAILSLFYIKKLLNIYFPAKSISSSIILFNVS